MPLTKQLIDAVVERYWREVDRYEKLAEFVGQACRSLLEENGIRGTVQSRAKAADRLKDKLHKYSLTGEHADEFVDLDSVFRVLKDLAGARITTYVETDRARVIALLGKRFAGFAADCTVVPDVKDQAFGFYRATHCMVRLRDDEAIGPYRNLRGLGCEIQVCSQLAHVYHELEHDVRYKPLSGDLSKTENDLLNALARLMEVGDTIINQTRDAASARERGRSGELQQRREPIAPIRVDRSLNLTGSPVLLDLAGLVQASRPDHDLPETPAALYHEMMMRLFAGGAVRGGSPASKPQLHAEQLLERLCPAAWELFDRGAGANAFDRHSILDALTRDTGCSPTDAAQLLAELVDLGLLETSIDRNVEERLRFVEATFHEFLAASHLASRINRDGWDTGEVNAWQAGTDRRRVKVCDVLDARAFDPSWQGLTVFVADLLKEPRRLLEALADRSKDDLYRHRLGLWCRCYRVLGAVRQTDVARRMEWVFKDILQIAKRCEHDDQGHRKPWLDWVELLLASGPGAERLCHGLLALSGRYRGWAVPLKVLEMFERVLTRENVTPSVVDAIARVSERDEHQWGVNTARLALRLADDEHKQELVSHFASMVDDAETASGTRIRLAEAVATSGDTTAATRAGEMLISLSQDESLSFEHRERSLHALVSLLDTTFASTAAALLVNQVLNRSTNHHFWLAWRIIGNAESAPRNAWSAVLLAVTLFADREDDQRLKLWSAQVLSQRQEPPLRELGLSSLWRLTKSKDSHAWVHAARWLVEYGPAQLADKARHALFDEASGYESDRRLEATAELLEMEAIDPVGGPIEVAVRKAVLRELKEHGEKYGSRLHLSAPGAPNGNVDLELFADNPAAVIKLLHTFHGPSPYLRDRGDPNEEHEKMRHWNAHLLYGTRYWPEVLQQSLQALSKGADSDRDGALGIALFGASASDLLRLLLNTVRMGRPSARMRHYLLEELNERGWRLRFCGRRIEVLHRGREESRAEGSAAHQ